MIQLKKYFDRNKVEAFINTPMFSHLVIGAIIVNSIVLGLLTIKDLSLSSYILLRTIDTMCLLLFISEVGMRIYVEEEKFFKNGWDIFDFIVITVSIIGESGIAVLRVLRVVRIIHLVYEVPVLRSVFKGFLYAIPSVQSIFVLLGIFFYAFSLMATSYFGATFPEWFGTIGASAYSLFQIMTLESWSSGIVRPVMTQYPYAWVFFVPFIMFATYIILNLFVGIIVNAIQASQTHLNYKLEEAQEHEIVTLNTIKSKLELLEKQHLKIVRLLEGKKKK